MSLIRRSALHWSTARALRRPTRQPPPAHRALEKALQEFPRIWFVFDHQHTHPIERDHFGGPRPPVGAARAAETSTPPRGEDDREGGTFAFAGAFGPDRPAVQLHEVLDDGQAEAEPAESARDRTVRLLEPIEDVRQKFARIPTPCRRR